jgi:hypothetical protein
MVLGAIVVCEVAFWLFLIGGLTARYVARRPALGMALLLGSPLADLALLALTAVDLRQGEVATQAHALAALYLGFTVAFGHRTIAWADRWFAYRFAGGPRPAKAPRTGRERVEYEWRLFGQAALGWAVTAALLVGLTAVTGDVQRAQALLTYLVTVTLILAIWFLTGPVPAMAAARRPPSAMGARGERD